MANKNKNRGRGQGQQPPPPPTTEGKYDAVLNQMRQADSEADVAIDGALPPEALSIRDLSPLVRQVAQEMEERVRQQGGGQNLEIMSRLTQHSLQDIRTGEVRAGTPNIKENARTLGQTLRDPDTTAISDLFFAERNRIDDYNTYEKIYEIVPFVREAAQTFVDNIVSPDDMTKRDVGIFYEPMDEKGTAASDSDSMLTVVRTRCRKLLETYNLDDKVEKALMHALVKGDYFMAVLNLRQEIQLALREEAEGISAQANSDGFTAQDIPDVTDADLVQLAGIVAAEANEAAKVGRAKGAAAITEVTGDSLLPTARAELSEYFTTLLEYNSNAEAVSFRDSAMAVKVARDLASDRKGRLAATGAARAGQTLPADEKEKKRKPLPGTSGSILKMLDPENVIKLYHDDVVFGYFYIEYASDVSDFGKKFSRDNTALARAVDRTLLSSTGQSLSPLDVKERLVQKLFVKTLAKKVGNADFISKNPQFSRDAYAILRRARQENKKVLVTYVAPDQMVHWTPDGAEGYGQSVMSGIKFLAKLYIGAMTNAFMRNSIRQPDKLVYYIDVGLDMDASNAVQNFIRTIKQKEVKFSNLKDITTTMRHVGEFHDLYIPTYNGERPVEIETINMSTQREVDSPFLDYLRKQMIAGMGVPAAFVGYSEEIAFARSLTMDNGRFLRRVIRHQKHGGRSYSRLMRLLYQNEYMDLEDLVGAKAASGETPPDPTEGAKPLAEADNEGGADSDGGATNAPDDQAEKDEKQPEPAFIVARFPSPATLNLTNMADLTDTAQRVSEFVITAVMGDAAEQDARDNFRRKAIKKLMPGLDWDTFEQIKKEVEQEITDKKAKEPDAGLGGLGGGGLGGAEGAPGAEGLDFGEAPKPAKPGVPGAPAAPPGAPAPGGRRPPSGPPVGSP